MQSSQNKTTPHVTIISIVQDQIGYMLKDFSSYPIRGKKPKNFLSFDEIDFSNPNLRGSRIGVLVKVKHIRTSDQTEDKLKFQRKVKVKNAINFINDELTGEKAGFSYDFAASLVGTLKFDNIKKQWYVFVNQGQHRTAMAYIVGGEDMEIPVLLDIPEDNISFQDQLIYESLIHFVDASKRTGQNQSDKIRSAYFCKDPTALYLVSFYDKCQTNVGELLEHEKFCDSWGEIHSGIKEYGEEIMENSLKACSKFSKEKQINARAVLGLARLCFFFKDRIESFEKLNCESFVESICKYVFVQRKPKVLSMGDITKYSGDIKDESLPMVMWIRYTNEMCEWIDYSRDNKANLWMTRRSKEWQTYLFEHVPDIFHEPYNQRLELN